MLGRAVSLTLGNVSDISGTLPLLRAVVPPRRLIADKAYDARSPRDWLKRHRVSAAILQRPPEPWPSSSIGSPACSALGSSACLDISRIRGVSQPAMIACPATNWRPLRSYPTSSHRPQ